MFASVNHPYQLYFPAVVTTNDVNSFQMAYGEIFGLHKDLSVTVGHVCQPSVRIAATVTTSTTFSSVVTLSVDNWKLLENTLREV